MFGLNFNNVGVYVGYSIYIFGGKIDAGTSNSTIWKHKPTSGTAAATGKTLASASYSHCSAKLPGGAAYIFGGKGGSGSYFNTIQKWDGTNRTSESATLVNSAYEASTTPANGNNLYVFGGWNDSTTYGTIQKWNGTSRTTESNSIIDTVYIRHSAATLNDTAYLFSGGNGSAVIGQIHKYDGVNAMTAGASTWAVEYGSSATLGSKIYTFKVGAGTNVASFDGTTWSSSVLTTPYGSQYATAQTYDNSIYIYGGTQGGTSNGDNDSTAYDSAITRWNTTAVTTLSLRLPTDIGYTSSAAV